jgi:hypothetical protein
MALKFQKWHKRNAVIDTKKRLAKPRRCSENETESFFLSFSALLGALMMVKSSDGGAAAAGYVIHAQLQIVFRFFFLTNPGHQLDPGVTCCFLTTPSWGLEKWRYCEIAISIDDDDGGGEVLRVNIARLTSREKKSFSPANEIPRAR